MKARTATVARAGLASGRMTRQRIWSVLRAVYLGGVEFRRDTHEELAQKEDVEGTPRKPGTISGR